MKKIIFTLTLLIIFFFPSITSTDLAETPISLTDPSIIKPELHKKTLTSTGLAETPISLTDAPIIKPELHKKILIDNVPFTAQAPFGDWADSRQQNGCEEASALMAVKWARGQTLTKNQALKEITDLADWLLKKYGENRDTATADMIAWIFNDYFKFDKAILVKNITVNDIIEALNKGNLIITPMNGQLMHNPNFVAPGPPRHMIVIRGYNPVTKEFITNDPGTRRGELYSYNAAILYEAIRDYPTGYHEIINQIEKNMIVIKK